MLILLGACAATIVAGLAIHFGGSGAGADFTGDALYAVLIYLLVALIAEVVGGVTGSGPPSPLRHSRSRVPSPLLHAFVAFIFCAGIELLQLTDFPRAATTAFPPFALILGAGFDPRDLLAYAVGVAVPAAVTLTISSRGRHPQHHRPSLE